jgi:hypothetical protein
VYHILCERVCELSLPPRRTAVVYWHGELSNDSD